MQAARGLVISILVVGSLVISLAAPALADIGDISAELINIEQTVKRYAC